MKRLFLLSALAVPAALAATPTPAPEWLVPLRADAQRLVEQWQAASAEVDAALPGLVAPQADADDADTADNEMPELAEGDTLASCRGGLMFDNANSTLIYLDRVQLLDERLRLLAEHRLFVKLRSMDPRPDAAQKTEESPTQGVQDVQRDITERARRVPQQLRGGRITIETTEAVADTASNILLLRSPARGIPVLVAQGRNSIRIQPQEGREALLVADAAGNVFMDGAHISLRWVDDEGREGKMECAGGSITYHAATHTLHLPGLTTMEHPRGTFQSESALTVVLQPDPDAGKPGDSYLSQFAKMSFKGVESVAVHQGSAKFDGYAASGELLQYNARTGACLVNGPNASLTYNANTITADRIALDESGNIAIDGNDVRMAYERPSRQNADTKLHGTVRCGALQFDAATGKVTTQAPIAIRDDELDFAAQGPTELTLRRAENPRPRPDALPSFALAEYDGVATLTAHRGVRLAAKSEQGDVVVMGDEVQADLVRQEATVTASGDNPLVVQGSGFRAAAQTAAGADAHSFLQMTEQGEITLSGSHISIEHTPDGQAPSAIVALSPQPPAELHVNAAGDISLKGEDIGIETHDSAGNSVKAVCRGSLTLEKEAGRLVTGSATRMQAAQGSFASNGPVTATLRPGAPRTARQNDRFAHLNYSFDGLQEASTPAGGSIRTPQGSMQCSGPMSVAFFADGEAPKPARAASPQQPGLGNLKSARAEGSVALAAKDSTGRVLRAFGDTLALDAVTGMKTLTGNTVTLSDQYNTHTASGGASITLDADNNARIHGATQRTTATHIHDQMEQQKKGN